MNEDIREITIFYFCALCVTAVLVSPAACTMHENQQIADAIKAGADPLEAKCAIGSMQGNNHVCTVIATKKERKTSP